LAVKQSPLIIGLTGPIGSGVTTLSQVLETNGFHRISLSDPIKAEFRTKKGLASDTNVRSVTGWRKDLQDIGDEGRAKGLTYWLDEAIKNIPQDKPVVIDSIRNEAEVNALRDRYTNSFLVAVAADLSARWERSKKEYANEREFTEADERDNEDKDERPHGQQVGKCVGSADYVLVNNLDLGSTANQRKGIWDNIKIDIELMSGKTARDPRDEEVHMATAYTTSYLSRCLKRYVGAVIVGLDSMPLSTGFNENPQGTQPCVRQWGYCFKDNAMDQELEERGSVHCPKCGKKNQFPADNWNCLGCKEGLRKQLFPSRNMEKCTAIHAEERAIRSLAGRSAKDGTMYVTTFPCLQCSRYIIDAGIKKVVYVEAYPVKEARKLLSDCGITVTPFSGFKARAFNIVFNRMS
jgi:deoxycytidylate deaminase